MTAVEAGLVLACLLAIAAVVVVTAVRVLRWAIQLDSAETDVPNRHAPRPFGPLPTPLDPVGELGALAPDADLGSTAADEDDLLGR